MRPLTKLTRQSIKKISLLSFDADGVTVEKGTEILEKDGVLTVKTKLLSQALLDKLKRLKKHFHINFTSGRSLLYLNRMYGPVLWEKASIQGENGLFTLIDGQVLQQDRLTFHELDRVEKIRQAIRKLAISDKNIKGFEPKQFLITVHCYKEDSQILDIVRRIDKRGEFYIYWNNEAYDIFLKRFTKGTGLEFLAQYLKLDLASTLVVGNDPNDKSIVARGGISITTQADILEAGFRTEEKLELGGEEVVNHLLKLV